MSASTLIFSEAGYPLTPMAYSSRHYANRFIPSNRFPTGLKWLLIVNVAIFVLWYFIKDLGAAAFFAISTSFPVR